MKKVYQCLSVFMITIITVGVFLIGCGGGGGGVSYSGGNNNNCRTDGSSCSDDQQCCSKWCYFGGLLTGYYCKR
jgi:hypothetical protein